jgi:dolichol-phosphate mannosyltransferase
VVSWAQLKMKAVVVTPTFNEVGNISILIRRIQQTCPELHVLVVDDGSPDGTAAAVEALQRSLPNVHLLNRTRKEGLGAAYTQGLLWALEHDYAHVVQMDADLSHPPELLPELLKALGNAPFAMGCRYMRGGGVSDWPWYRRMISRAGNLYARIALGIPVQDLTGGFIAWRRETLSHLQIRSVESKGYAYLIELKFRAFLGSGRPGEIPFVFHDRQAGESKMSWRIFLEAALRVLTLRTRKSEILSQLRNSPTALEHCIET